MCAYIKQKPCTKVFKTYQVGKKSTNAFNAWLTDEYHFYYLEMCMYASITGQ